MLHRGTIAAKPAFFDRQAHGSHAVLLHNFIHLKPT